MGFMVPARFYKPAEFEPWLLNAFAFDGQHGGTGWRPRFVVLHNTSEPTIAQRPRGFFLSHMENLRDYYNGMGWHAGPHLFVDQNGIWVFSPLDAPGVHSPSWNAWSWGVELLGEYESEGAQSGPGATIVHNAVIALAAMHVKAGIDTSTLKLHKFDPLTTHKTCPGRNIDYGDIQMRVHIRMVQLKAATHS